VRLVKELISLIATLACVFISAALFKKEAAFILSWAGFGIEFNLRIYQFSAFILGASSIFSFLIAIYSSSFMRQRERLKQFYAYLLISAAFVNGAVLSDNLVLMLFFWEGLLITLFGMIAIGNKDAFKTALKAFVIVGIADLCMMAGIALTAHLAGTLTISRIALIPSGLGTLAFILLVIGAISKAGSMPFHSWIPDAAVDAPLPFMAFLPASLEKLLGIYFLSRITLDMFKIKPDSHLSTLLMGLGAITIILAVMMALIQKDYKRLLSYHAISQVGYMVLGIGTALPVGIVGGLFHMLNNAMYKSCLFLTAGSVEKNTGTTDLSKLGGLMRKMPVTFACFLVAAVSISGVPPFNGFFSKELIYDAALRRGMVFYIAATLGSFFTAISFLKLGHCAFAGKLPDEQDKARESGFVILIPMVAIALLCMIFGVWNALPLNNLIQPVLGERLEGHNYAGLPHNWILAGVALLVIMAAVISHFRQVKLKGCPVKSVDYIHYAPVLKQIYFLAERKLFDPYTIGMFFARISFKVLYYFDRLNNWLYDGLSAGLAVFLSGSVRRIHNGNFMRYLGWSLLGTVMVVVFLMMRSWA
jgi:NADH-quinone oxidoreductase subunit L